MKPEDRNSSPLLKQITKLFEDLAARQQEKPKEPVSPRITCTRLRRLREIRRELVLDSDTDPQTQNEAGQDFVNSEQAVQKRNESFGDWVIRNQQAHQQFADKQSQLREQAHTGSRENVDQGATGKGFSNFSPSALQVVAKNPNTPISTLKWLAAHYRMEVRQAVALNENIDPEILSTLIHDSEDRVRAVILDNINLPHDFLLKLCDDHSPLVSEKAKNILYEKTSSDLKNSQKPVVSESVHLSAGNPELETSASKQEITSEESKIIEKEFLGVIAERSTTPPRRLAELAVHPSATIRALVAANPNSTSEIFWQLAKDPLPQVRIKLIGNYNCPTEVIDYLRNII